MVIFDDDTIAQLIAEVKPLPKDALKKLRPDLSSGKGRRELEIVGAGGSEFRVMVRQVVKYPDNFSVILAFKMPNSSAVFVLRRYNSKEEHTNRLEGETFFGYHIHMATQRYQEVGRREECYALATDRYSNVMTAIECLIDDCGFQRHPDEEYDRSLLRGLQ